MTGFIHYQFKSYIRSLKIIPPLTVFTGWVIILYIYKGLPILSSYAITSIVLYLVMTWVVIGVFSIEEEAEKYILFVQLGSKYRFLWGKWAVCIMIAFVLSLYAIIYPVLMNNFKGPIMTIHIALSFYSHIFLALFGILVGSFFSVTSLASKKYSWLLAMLVMVLSISYERIVEKAVIFKWLFILFPPIVNVTKYLSRDDTIHIGRDFWVYSGLAFVYMVVCMIVVVKMFLRKEK
ncbi:hypothetical protein ACQKP0_18630 [Heyndrickxia sp. NPDC080065]|uniref:hypothetical protein n=1 Tax=Heyndrickxia sp. NPDC080065 TaxID=3390568 RepID=UPI003CFF4323